MTRAMDGLVERECLRAALVDAARREVRERLRRERPARGENVGEPDAAWRGKGSPAARSVHERGQ